MKKYFYDQFGKEIDKESKELKAHSEKTPININKCNHSKAKIVGNELRCVCGSAWSGGNIEMLQKMLVGDIIH